MIDQHSLQTILGISEKVHLTPEEMADKMNITFFPYKKDNLSQEIIDFAERLKKTFTELDVNIVPYEKSLEKVSLYKVLHNISKILLSNILFFFRKLFGLSQKSHYFNLSVISYLFKRTKIKKGISVVVLGDQLTENLPMQYIYNFKDNSIVTILDFPQHITTSSSFHEHFNTALSLFAHHMTNIVVAVDKEKWIVYNFNASHPIFPLSDDATFKKNVMYALIPKIVAPIRPYKLSEFLISKDNFDINDEHHKKYVDDLVQGALLFGQTNLYPDGKKIDELPFRNDFYRWIGKLHLDNRNGMSYGFLAVQLPTKLSPLLSPLEFKKITKYKPKDNFYFADGDLYVRLKVDDRVFWMKVPDVWVLSQKSGSDKVHVKPERDLIKMGLSNGKMVLQTQYGSILDNDYKTSFDTQVILAHAVGNAILASVSKHLNMYTSFVQHFEENGMSISHWHGYVHPEFVPEGWFVYGRGNPHVACSSPQSAMYALGGKLRTFSEVFESASDFRGDIHIEPHHGTNMCFTTVTDLANYLVKNKTASVLGNSYYYLYNKSV